MTGLLNYTDCISFQALVEAASCLLAFSLDYIFTFLFWVALRSALDKCVVLNLFATQLVYSNKGSSSSSS